MGESHREPIEFANDYRRSVSSVGLVAVTVILVEMPTAVVSYSCGCRAACSLVCSRGRVIDTTDRWMDAWRDVPTDRDDDDADGDLQTDRTIEQTNGRAGGLAGPQSDRRTDATCVRAATRVLSNVNDF